MKLKFLFPVFRIWLLGSPPTLHIVSELHMWFGILTENTVCVSLGRLCCGGWVEICAEGIPGATA